MCVRVCVVYVYVGIYVSYECMWAAPRMMQCVRMFNKIYNSTIRSIVRWHLTLITSYKYFKDLETTHLWMYSALPQHHECRHVHWSPSLYAAGPSVLKSPGPLECDWLSSHAAVALRSPNVLEDVTTVLWICGQRSSNPLWQEINTFLDVRCVEYCANIFIIFI